MKLLSIEGGIGSGKSTIINSLKEMNLENFIFVPEPINDWDLIKDKDNKTMLQKFYGEKEKYSFSFQMMAYISRLTLLQEAVTNNPNATIVTERSLDTDRHVFAKMLYDDGYIEDVCMQIYLKWFDHFMEDIKIKNIIYIDTTPEKCLDRIKKRSRLGEELIPIEYLVRCNEYYKIMMTKYDNENVLNINGNIDYDDAGLILKNRLETIIQFCRI